MPRITRCHKWTKPGFQYGTYPCHTYTPGNYASQDRALKKAQDDKARDEQKKAKSQRWLLPRLLHQLT